MSSSTLTPNIAKNISILFSDYKLDSSSASLSSSLSFYIQNINRIGEDLYIPTAHDVLRVRRPATINSINQFTIDSNDIKNLCFIDVGGKREQRKRWPNELIGVNLIIYLVSMDEYDMKLEEDNESNRLIESLKLWKFLLTRDYLLDTPFLLLFTKPDLMKEKIKKVPFSSVFTNFNDFITSSDVNLNLSEYEKSCNYLTTQFYDIFLESYKGTTNKAFTYIVSPLIDINIGKELSKVVQSTIKGEQKKSNK
jgi:hypothetical protein